ncbi:MAG: hypothetical protein ACRCV2_00475 [Cetobacterium sp.]
MLPQPFFYLLSLYTNSPVSVKATDIAIYPGLEIAAYTNIEAPPINANTGTTG